MQWSLSRNLSILVGVLVLGVVFGAIFSDGLVSGQAPSGLAQQDQQLLDELVAKDEIREQIYNYSRGLDRMDMELAKQVWHPDGTTNILGVFEGTGEGWIDWLWDTHDPFVGHSHQMSNILLEVDGDTAVSETYMTATLRAEPTENSANMTMVRGRYADRWSKRDGRWAIDHRLYTLDFTTGISSTGTNQSVPSRRDRTDPSYQVYPH